MTEQQKERLKKWIAALRSGDYKQTKGQLRDVAEDGHVYYCCLGVACDIAAKKLGGKWDEETMLFGVGGESEYSILPPAVRAWLGISGSFEATLVNANDGTGERFKIIANRIEDYLEGKP